MKRNSEARILRIASPFRKKRGIGYTRKASSKRVRRKAFNIARAEARRDQAKVYT